MTLKQFVSHGNPLFRVIISDALAKIHLSKTTDSHRETRIRARTSPQGLLSFVVIPDALA